VSRFPVILFAYARPVHLARVLACLRENRVGRLYAFSDGARADSDGAKVAEVRTLLRAVDWCEVVLVERASNLGLGRNVLSGISEVVAKEPGFIVWEDDLICVPGCLAWLQAALECYQGDPRVMSVTGWTHPDVAPSGLADRPYFDGRAECWVWGTWSDRWKGIGESTALEFMAEAEGRGIARSAYGSDLPAMAAAEVKRNLWAVRWLYAHLARGKLCLRPPWSMVEHIGFDADATNAAAASRWANPPLRPAPAIPGAWPEASENPQCRARWAAASTAETVWAKVLRRLARLSGGAR
jgi:hypothetical protein